MNEIDDKWKEIKNVIIYTLACTILFVVGIYGVSRMQSCEQLRDKKQYTTLDTQVIIRFKDEVRRDTVYIWYERILRAKHDPVKVLQQRVDSATAEEIGKADAMLRVAKADGELRIYTYNQFGEAVKEYIFDDVGRGFTATSIEGGLNVESDRFYWEGIWLTAGVDIENMDFRTGYKPKVGLETGIDYIDKIRLDGGLYFDTRRKEFDLRVGLGVRLK
jgi:Na+-transporting NADH:ubiquinone oxidoreductase subunit NqrC